MNLRSIISFLFPEKQVYDAVHEYGWFNVSGESKRRAVAEKASVEEVAPQNVVKPKNSGETALQPEEMAAISQARDLELVAEEWSDAHPTSSINSDLEETATQWVLAQQSNEPSSASLKPPQNRSVENANRGYAPSQADGIDLTELTCKMCGSTKLRWESGIIVCESCGTSYSITRRHFV